MKELHQCKSALLAGNEAMPLAAGPAIDEVRAQTATFEQTAGYLNEMLPRSRRRRSSTTG